MSLSSSTLSPVHDVNTLHQTLSNDYVGTARRFYAYLPDDVRELFISDAVYHGKRYLEMLQRRYGPAVLELGSDKPFITHFLRTLNPQARFETVSIDIPFSPYPITRVDIESAPLPFADGTFTDVVFTEVIEHLFRDPAWALFQINRVTAPSGRLFLTTPNACGYDSLINLLHQRNPNARSQFFASIESGHPHLWTADECELILREHGFEIIRSDTVDYVEFPFPRSVKAFLQAHARDPQRHGQSLRIEAVKRRDVGGPRYPTELFPEGKPVQLQGALREWARQVLSDAPDGTR